MRSDDKGQGLADHEEHTLPLTCDQTDPWSVGSREGPWPDRLREPLWLLYPCKPLAQRGRSLNVSSYYHCSQSPGT